MSASGHYCVRLHGIAPESVVDGPGLRYVIFTQGCPHGCPGCHNPASHDPLGGFVAPVADLLDQIAENPLLSGITLSGGEPFLQAAPLCLLAEAVKARGLTVLTYSGYTLAQLRSLCEPHERGEPHPAATSPHAVPRSPCAVMPADAARLLALTDILIDGPYIEALRDLTLSFRGSSNQRIWKQIAGIFTPIQSLTPSSACHEPL